MIVLPISADQSDGQVLQTLARAAADAAPGARLTIMTHGYRFEPGHPVHCPHRHILSARPAITHFKALSWARHLHLGRDGVPPGIGFGWPARGGLAGAYRRALLAGDRLGEILSLIACHFPGLGVNLVAHSLGARVVLRATATAPVGVVDRILLLSAAEYAAPARAHLSTPAGRRAQVINVASRGNAPFNLVFRALARPAAAFAAHASGAVSDLPNWTEMSIDADADRAAAARLGFAIRPAPQRVCHWSTYRRGGLFPLYRALLDPERPDLLADLRAALHDQCRSAPGDAGFVGGPGLGLP